MMKNQNFTLKNALIVFAMALLSSCACLHTSDFNKKQEQLNLTRQCEQAEVLVTDLTDDSPNRTYVLPSGQVCPAKE